MPEEQIKIIHRLASISFRIVLILSKPYAGERGDGTVQDFCKLRINIQSKNSKICLKKEFITHCHKHTFVPKGKKRNCKAFMKILLI